MALARRRFTNFGRNVSFVPTSVYLPKSVAEVLEFMGRHPGERIRCMGAGHSWSAVLATDGVLFDMRRLNDVTIEPDYRVRVGAGCTLRRLLRCLRRRNLTLPTLGAIKRQTVAGAIATGTHGSGVESLSHFVEEAKVALFDPATQAPCLKTFDSGLELRAARCALGSLGIVVEVVLQTVDRYRVEERTDKMTSIDDVLKGLHDSPPWLLQQFGLLPWSWQFVVFRRRKTSKPVRGLRAWMHRMANILMTDVGLHLILKALLAYARLSRWAQLLGFTRFTGDTSIRAFFRAVVPRLIREKNPRVDDSTAILTQHHAWFRHVEMEVFVPESRLCKAIALIKEIVATAAGEKGEMPEVLEYLRPDERDEVFKLRGSYTLHYVIFFRRVLSDETLISMASKRGEPAWYAISFFTYRAVDNAFARFAGTIATCLMESCGARPHWGKYFPVSLDRAASQYPHFDQFRNICRQYDPKQQFWY